MNTPLLVANMVLAAVAGWVNIHQARKCAHASAAPFRWLRGGMALFYSALYALQVTTLADTLTITRVVNLATWVVMWTLPALVKVPEVTSDRVMEAIMTAWRADMDREVKHSPDGD